LKPGNYVITHANELVTVSGFQAKKGREMSDLQVISDGAVVIKNGIIQQVGATQEILQSIDISQYPVLNATGRAVLPGFIDSHTHFVFGGYRSEEYGWRLRGDSYMDIMQRGGGIIQTVTATRNASKEELIQEGKKRLDSMLSFGVTTVEGKSGYGLDEETEIKQLEVMGVLNQTHPVDIVSTFLGAHAVPTSYKGKEDEYIQFLIEQVLPKVVEGKLAEFCDVFCEKNVFSIEQSRNLLTKAKEMGLQVKLHADEIFPLGGAELAAELHASSADHLLHASDEGIHAMAKANVVATLLPATAFSLKESYARAREMIDHGCAVALATDMNPGSCFTESIPLIIALSTLYMGMTIEETITSLTLNAAAGVGRASSIGSIDVGKKGDLVILEHPSYHFLPYHLGVSIVEKVIKNGILVFDKRNEG